MLRGEDLAVYAIFKNIFMLGRKPTLHGVLRLNKIYEIIFSGGSSIALVGILLDLLINPFSFLKKSLLLIILFIFL